MSNKTKGLLLVILASLCYGIMPALTQTGYKLGLEVPTVLTGRYLFGTAAIFGFIVVRALRKPGEAPAGQKISGELAIGGRNTLLLCLVGVNVFVCVNFMTLSYKYVPGAVTSLLTFLYIVIVNVFMMLTGRESATKIRLICLTLTVAGLVLVVMPSSAITLDGRGVAFGIGAGVLYAIWTISMGARRFEAYSPEVTMAYMLLVPTAGNVVSCLVNNVPVLPQSPGQWGIVLALALTPGFIAPVAFCAGVKAIGAGTASMINTSEPVIAYVVGAVIMGDQMSLGSTFGGLLVVAGLLLLQFGGRQKPSEIGEDVG